MVFFSFKESLGWNHLRDNRGRERLRLGQLADRLLSRLLLLLVQTEDDRTILRSHIMALPIQRRRVMGPEKNLEQVRVGDRVRVELDAHTFRMSSLACADLLVGRLRCRPSAIAAYHRLNATQLIEDRLRAPETTTAQDGDLERILI